MRRFALVLCAVLAATPALAHPHVFIEAAVIAVFNDRGELTAVRHEWRFDPAISAWQSMGLDADGDGLVSGEEMAALAATTMRDLALNRFYTTAGEGVDPLPLASMDDGRMQNLDGRTLLEFGIEPQEPYRIRERLEIAVYDPEYYTAFSFDHPDAVRLVNAPAGCSIAVEPPRLLPPELEEQLYSLPATVTKLPPELAAALRGREGAVVVTCGGTQ